MSYNGVGLGTAGVVEDPQHNLNGHHHSNNNQNNANNNWPFSVRYTASPYRKSKFPLNSSTSTSTESTSLPPHINISSSGSHHHNQGGVGGHQFHSGLSSSSSNGIGGNHNHNHYHTQQTITQHNNLQKYHLIAAAAAAQQDVHVQQFHNLNNPLAYQNHFVALKQHQQQQQQLLQQRQRQYDHHHYGLPVSAIPPGVILHTSNSTTSSITTKTLLHQQHLNHQHQEMQRRLNGDGSGGNQHFRMRYPVNFGRNRTFNLNECHLDQVEGLDEGYIEDLKQHHNNQTHQPITNTQQSDVNGSAISAAAAAHHQPGLFRNSQPTHPCKGNCDDPLNYDPYSYVYDSQLIKEDLSVCSASLNQVFLTNPQQTIIHKIPYPLPHPPPYQGPKVISSSENEYEEIRDVQRYMNHSDCGSGSGGSGGGGGSCGSGDVHINGGGGSSGGSFQKVLNENFGEDGTPPGGLSTLPLDSISNGKMGPPKHFKSFSTSTDDILAEVVQVQQKHDRVLDQLNLEVENLLIKSSTDIETGVGVVCCTSCTGKEGQLPPTEMSTGVVSRGKECKCGYDPDGGVRGRMIRGNSYSTLLPIGVGGMEKCTMTSGIGGGAFTGGGTFGRRKKLDRSLAMCNGIDECKCTDGGSGSYTNILNGGCGDDSSHNLHQKIKVGRGSSVTTGDETDEVTKVKSSRYQRSLSLIPNWKIRDHLMRLPFLRHHHDKLKKGEGRGMSCSISGQEFSTLQDQKGIHHQHHHHHLHQQGIVNHHKLSSTNNIMSATTTINNTGSGASGAENSSPSAMKTRSSSMDELRSTGEEHWYSADSDTDPDSITAIPTPDLNQIQEQPESEDQQVSGSVLITNCGSEVCNNKVNSVNGNNCGNGSCNVNNTNNINQTIRTPGNYYSNCGDHNGSRMECGSVIPDVPKAPKFRGRGTGLKDKWRESWSSKTLLKSTSMEDENRLLRWFSLRKNSAQLDPSGVNNRHSTLPQLSEEDLKRISFMDDEEGYWPRRTVQPPTLPAPPKDLSSDQLTRRHILTALVHSENNYVAALQRLVNEYKKPLECSHPAILSHSKISAVFHRLPEILQCHSLFRIALADCVRKWDTEERIGDVFVASFSKSLVLDVYSEFINNFGTAMETAKVEARRKSAFAEFLKVKQMTAHDRLSLFGLMVKPVQRFPQFILLLQDLLKNTPKDHHDRMSLQLALTQLESLAAMLNERKRESEQYQAFRETIKSIGGSKFIVHRSIVDDPNRILLRQDVVTQLEFDNNGGTVAKSKCRKLLLLNDMLICTTVSGSSSLSGDNNLRRKDSNPEDDNQNSRGKSEKSVFKWSFPVRDVEVEDISISPTMSRFVHNKSNSMSNGSGFNGSSSGSLKSSGNSATNAAAGGTTEDSASISLLEEMKSLMHDYEVLSRILGLVSALKSSYEGLTVSTVKELMLEIQHQIRCRDEQISYFDSSCLTLILGNGNSKEKVVFQMQSPQARSAWIEELRLAQLALDPNNSPAWDIPSESPYPHHKLPLFVRALPLSKQPHLTTVKCGCFFTHTFVSQTGRSKILDYLWVSSTDGMSSHMTAFRSQQNTLKEFSSFDLVEEKINDMLFVLGHIWVATESRKIMMFDPADPDKGQIGQHILSDSVLKLLFYNNNIYAGLADGNIAVFTTLDSPDKILPEVVIQVGNQKIAAMFGSREHVYAAVGNSVVTLHTKTHTIERNVVLNHHNGPISHMTCSGVGLWITTQDSGTVCLYHLESFQHLQDVGIAPSVYRTVRDSFRRSKGVHVTCLTAHKGWLWIGTNVGVILTIPLPRLEGVPIISTGNANVSYHGFCGPVTFLMPLMKAPLQAILPPSSREKSTSDKLVSAMNDKTQVDPSSQEDGLSSKPKLEQNQASIDEEPAARRQRVGGGVSFSESLQTSEDVGDKSSLTSSNNTDSGVDIHNIPNNEIKSPQTPGAPSTQNSADTALSKDSLLGLLANGVINSSDKTSSSSSIENASSPSPSACSKTLVVLRKKSSKDNVFLRNCKTLPRGGPLPSNLRFSTESDVYGLYGNLINVRGLEDEGRFVDPLYDALRRSDPELNSLDSKISTLHRRLKMRMSRPRSLDLSNWSVDSKISASSDESVGIGSMRNCTHSTTTTDSMTNTNMTHNLSDSSPIPPNEPETKGQSGNSIQNSKGTLNNGGTTKKKGGHNNKSKSSKNAPQERTVLVVVGGRGYLNMRSLGQEHFISTTDSETKSCPHLTLWQMKT